MANQKVTAVTPGTHEYLAQRVIAFCAAYADVNFDPAQQETINTDELIAAACGQFGITGWQFQHTYEMREEYTEILNRTEPTERKHV
ncbi:MAG TPA: hypothetical protein VN794_01270 [Methylomirabilota bacterium]|nr:hypothetical protein [Methylomirabilota bacterium]